MIHLEEANSMYINNKSLLVGKHELEFVEVPKSGCCRFPVPLSSPFHLKILEMLQILQHSRPAPRNFKVFICLLGHVRGTDHYTF